MMKTRRADSPRVPLQMRRGPADDEIQDFFDRMAGALTRGDGEAVADLWAVPALVLSDRDARAVDSLEDEAAFFGGARDQFHRLGSTDTRAQIVGFERLTSRIVMVDVRWPWLDDTGAERGEETSTYLLRRDDSGELKLQAVIMRGTGGVPQA